MKNMMQNQNKTINLNPKVMHGGSEKCNDA